MITKQLSEASFGRMARHDPGALLALLASGDLSPGLLTHAAEIAAERLGDEVVPYLVNLLGHRSPVVREGAVMGLSHHVASECFPLGEVSESAASDPSSTVREVARSLVEECRYLESRTRLPV